MAVSPQIVAEQRARLTHLWGRRGFWQLKIRWFVAPLIALSALVARAIGFEFPVVPVIVIAVSVAGYNLILVVLGRLRTDRFEAGRRFDKVLTAAGAFADYAALLLLVHFTGGVLSPLMAFLVFHVIIAAIQFRPVFSHQIAAVAAAGVWLMLWLQLSGWWPPAVMSFRGKPFHGDEPAASLIVPLIFFTATLFLTAAIASWIMVRFRQRVSQLVTERTDFMLQTAHNLRAPLGASLSMLDLVNEGYAGPTQPKQKEILGKIDGRLRSLHRMIGELLTIAKTRDWSREITDVVVNLETLGRHTEETFRQDAENKKIRFEVRVDEGLPDVDSGADLLDQVMENLVSNAIKYTPGGGEVSVHFTQVTPGEVRIMVRDDGMGIPAAEQGKLFGEFFRASNAKRASASGTGLGLALVKKTVERHRGRIHLASEVDEGTTVVIDLPVRQG